MSGSREYSDYEGISVQAVGKRVLISVNAAGAARVAQALRRHGRSMQARRIEKAVVRIRDADAAKSKD